MEVSFELKGIVLAVVSGLAAIGMAFAAGEIFRPKAAVEYSATAGALVAPAGTQAYRGHRLFLVNCAHCHGSDARGDEGPDLHGVRKSDARISLLIRNGIKGRMPKFGEKLTDTDVRALVEFIRSLKDT